MKKFFLFLLSSLLFLNAVCPAFALPSAAAPDVLAGGYILMEQGERVALCSLNADRQLSPASTTKIMTCLVVLERCALTEDVTVLEEGCGVEGSSAYLRPGEHLTVEELLYCLMLRSANDAAQTLALYTAGSIEEFARLMNEKAEELGLSGTHFANPHGLSAEGHYTCAKDLALLTCAALENPTFEKIVSTKSIVIGSGENSRYLTNHNKLLFSLEGCIGVKTGYTMEAGRCLVSACRREETTLVCVTLSCKNDWISHTELYQYGFKTIKRFTLPEESFTVPYAGSDIPVAVTHSSYSFLASPDDHVTFETVCPHMLYAPIKEGENVGYISVLLNGAEIAQVEVCSTEERVESPKKNIFQKIIDFIFSLFQKNRKQKAS